MPPSKARPEGGERIIVEDTWHPWKMTAIGTALVAAAAVVMGLLMTDWGPRTELEATPAVASAKADAQSPAPADVEACNQYAKAQAGDKAIEVVKEGAAAEARTGPGKGAAIGGMVTTAAGTLQGINERKKNDARYVEAYRACMKGRGFSS
jgi:hypothetical protein